MKQNALTRHGLNFENLACFPADFAGQNLREILERNSGYDSAADTLFIAEGILMYLTPAKVAELFDSVRQACRAQCHFAFTVMEPAKDGSLFFHNANPMVNLWLRLKNEPFYWGMAPENLPAFLNANGFKLLEIATEKTFRELYLPKNLQNSPSAKGEYVCVAQRA